MFLNTGAKIKMRERKLNGVLANETNTSYT